MKTLLIYPEFPDTFWSFKHALKFIRRRAALPPLGLLTIGAMLPKAWTKKVVDLNVTKLTEKDLLWADYAFISGMVVQRESARKIIARCKEAGLKIIAGGPLFTSESDEFEDVDHFVLNEAELTLPPFLEDLEKGCAQRIYKTSEFCDVRKTPAPMWELIDLKHYASMSIQFSHLLISTEIRPSWMAFTILGGADRFFLWMTTLSATRPISRVISCPHSSNGRKTRKIFLLVQRPRSIWPMTSR